MDASGSTSDETFVSGLSTPVSVVSHTPKQTWTPSCWTGLSDTSDSEDEEVENKHPVVVQAFNDAMKHLSEIASIQPPAPVIFQLKTTWESATEDEKEQCISNASEACRMICKIIAPEAGENLYQSLPQEKPVSQELITLMTAYSNAPTRNLKTQILSIYAYDYPIKKLQALHEPYTKVSQWQIKRARAHAKENGPGFAVIKAKRHRISLDMEKVDHFVDFVNRPYFHQDVAFGMRKLKLESGETIEMPNVVRTVTRSAMIAQYQTFCTEQSFETLSKSTLYRILEVREASQRKSLQGLDNTAAYGSTAFQTIKSIIEQLVQMGVDKRWSENVTKRLDHGKQYLQTDYKVHCKEVDSLCADHCRYYGLSDPGDEDLQENCSHVHNLSCEQCEDIKSVIEEIGKKIQFHSDPRLTKDHRDDLLHDFNEAKNHIMMWKAHIMRSVNQELAKQQALLYLDDSSTLLVMDWAMKFVQIKYREKQSEWYGKRGMSWHITSAITKNSETKELEITSYVHLFDSSTQDWFAVASIVENLLQHIKTENQLINKIYLRSDEAGCYHNNLLVAAVNDIGKRIGVSVHRYDYSEPQQGKDVCDRIICPLKSSLRRYCNEGNDILEALQMHAALQEHPVKGTLASVNKINNSVKQLEVNKLKNFSAFHNFKYDSSDIIAWKAYGIGKGKTISKKSIYVSHQERTDMEVVQSFCGLNQISRSVKKKATKDSPNIPKEYLFECKEPGCNFVFESLEQVELHMEVGEHSRFVNKESVYDTLRREWAAKFTTINEDSITGEISRQSTATISTPKSANLSMGWALAKPRTGWVRFSPKVKEYLVIKFDCGERTGTKANPEKVALDMRQANDKDGKRLFTREEWLNNSQIKGFFSRLAKLRRKAGVTSSSDLYENMTDDSDHEESCDEEEEEDRAELVNRIVSTITVKHPIFYDVYDLCDIHHQDKLGTFKVNMLKEMCSHFELNFKSKDRKADLIKLIADMVSKCTCSQL